MATYPIALSDSTTLPPRAYGQVVNADDVNLAYYEIIAIEAALGASPATSGSWGTSGSFTSGTTAWTSTAARIQNIENGFYTVWNNYVSNKGGSSILPAASSTIGLVLKGSLSQSANMLEVQPNGSSTPTASVAVDGTVTGTTLVLSTAITNASGTTVTLNCGGA